jgi:hypothetical protein
LTRRRAVAKISILLSETLLARCHGERSEPSPRDHRALRRDASRSMP